MTKAEIKQRQQTLRDAGYDVTVDGKDGDSTQKAWAQYQNSQARADQARAAADQAKAGAEAERAKAEAEKIRATAEIERQRADEQKRNDEAAERQREFERKLQSDAETEARESREGLRKAGINAVALGAGVVGGLAYAKVIDAHRNAAVTNAAPKLAGLAKDARTTIRKYEAGKNVPAAAKKLRGIVNAADKAKFTAKAPIGFGPAAVLLAEGALSRFVIAPQFKDETTREAFQSIGTTSAVAASTIIGKGMVNVATPATPVNGRDLGAIEQARTIADAEAKHVRAKTPVPRSTAKIAVDAVKKAKPVVKVAGGAAAIAVAGPLVAALTAYDATKNSAMAAGDGEVAATAKAAAFAAGAGAAVAAAGIAIGRGIAKGINALGKIPGVKAIASKAGPAAIVGAATYAGYEGYTEGGVPGAAIGVADSVTGGLLRVGNAYARQILLPPEHDRRPAIMPRASNEARAYLNSVAAARGQTQPAPKPVVRASHNGWVAGYVRGDGVRVEGYRRAH
jgi:peptidoglycan hydrolase-like protein with peptidoglycan-binding domain